MSELETVVIRITPKNKILLVYPMLDSIVTINQAPDSWGDSMGKCHLTIFRRSVMGRTKANPLDIPDFSVKE
jgi:hypothetical protein